MNPHYPTNTSTPPFEADYGQLSLNFQKAGENLVRCLQEMSEATAQLIAAPVIVPAQPAQEEEAKLLRKMIRKVVGNIVDQSGMSWHQTWCLAYNHLVLRHGFSAAYHYVHGGCKSKLDACQQYNMLPHLHDIVQEMLVTRDYSTKVTLEQIQAL